MKFLLIVISFIFISSSLAQEPDQTKPKLKFSHRITGDHNFPWGQTSIKYHVGFKKGIHDFYIGIGPSAQFESYYNKPNLGYAAEISYFVGKKKSKFGMNLEFGTYWIPNYNIYSNIPNGYSNRTIFLNFGYAYRGDHGFEVGLYYGFGAYNEADHIYFWPLNLKLVLGFDFDKLEKR